MTWTNVNSIIEDDDLHVVQEKTEVEVDLPLAGLLGAFEGEERGDYWITNTVTGGRLTRESVGNWFGDAIAAAGLPKGQNGCPFHGLRATTATQLANNGAAPHENMSVTGHKTLKEVER